MLTIIPTDTCYWLAGEFSSWDDYLEIYRLKGRDFSNRLAVLVSDWDMLREYSEITGAQIEFLRTYPHPWSIVLKRKSTFILPDFLDSAQYAHISFRVADTCIPDDIRDSLRYPLFLTSANLSGQKESTILSEVRTIFPGVDGYDGWVCDHPPSDIFSISGDGELQYVRRNYT